MASLFEVQLNTGKREELAGNFLDADTKVKYTIKSVIVHLSLVLFGVADADYYHKSLWGSGSL
jgi:hypothetical protein